MEGYSRDLLRGIGGGDDQRPQRMDLEAEEVELSLGLSLGGRFGPDRSRLPRSSSVACILAPEEVALAPPALARTSSLPTMADADAGNKLSLGGLNAARTNAAEVEHSATLQGSGVAVGPVAKLPASGSPSPGSSNGEGKIHEGCHMYQPKLGNLEAYLEEQGEDHRSTDSGCRMYQPKFGNLEAYLEEQGEDHRSTDSGCHMYQSKFGNLEAYLEEQGEDHRSTDSGCHMYQPKVGNLEAYLEEQGDSGCHMYQPKFGNLKAYLEEQGEDHQSTFVTPMCSLN